MSIRVQARFADPGEAQVTLTMTARLERFEELRRALSADTPVPHYMVSDLIRQIDAASRALRGMVEPPICPRRMLPGDIGL